MNLDDKKKIVDELHERLAKAEVVILTDYKGLNVAAATELRKQLREAGVEYSVVKNSLLSRAAQDTDVAAISDAFKGPSAVAISYDDPVAPAKVLTKFALGNDKLEIKVGVLQNKVLDFSAIKALADLPPRDVLLAQFLSALNGVPTGFVRTLSAIPTQLLNVLQAIKDQKEAA